MDRAKRNKNGLRAARTARGWSQDALADAANVRQARVSRLEQGVPPVAVLNALRIARALGTTVEDLFGECVPRTGVHTSKRERLECSTASV